MRLSYGAFLALGLSLGLAGCPQQPQSPKTPDLNDDIKAEPENDGSTPALDTRSPDARTREGGLGSSPLAGDDANKTPNAGANSVTKAGVIAEAVLMPKSGSSLKGKATFTEKNGQITCEIIIEGVPQGPHAAHIHEKGDCSADDASSAGAHWNPTGQEHGKFGEGKYHLGDLFNIEVTPDGKGVGTLTTDKWTIGTGAQNDLVGKSVIIHEKSDDFSTQPSGAAGGRIGCGEIRLKR